MMNSRLHAILLAALILGAPNAHAYSLYATSTASSTIDISWDGLQTLINKVAVPINKTFGVNLHLSDPKPLVDHAAERAKSFAHPVWEFAKPFVKALANFIILILNGVVGIIKRVVAFL